ncbi:HAMP domain-containing protein [Pseudomonas sp. MAFF212428]|uniref:HAMP domain-containing protein n=1 Tax=Pseudomonas brassicae TaxID=2708063 RepID=A0A6M0CVY7_9PSED|nr:HAMP domain-containing protein [Pseudomonas brassicae]
MTKNSNRPLTRPHAIDPGSTQGERHIGEGEAGPRFRQHCAGDGTPGRRRHQRPEHPDEPRRSPGVVNHLLDHTNDIRAARLSFEHHGEQVYVTQLQASYAALVPLIEQNRQRIQDPPSLQHLETVVEHMKDYMEQFQQLQLTQQDIGRLQADADRLGEALQEGVRELTEALLRDEGSGVQPALGQLNNALSDLRQNNLAMMREGSANRLGKVRDAQARASTSLQQLGARLSSGRQAALSALAGEFTQYLQLAERFATNVAQQAQYRTVLIKDIESSLEATNNLIARQNQLSAEESARNRALMLALLLLAAILGALIGWVITRQITLPLQQAVQIAQRIGAGDLTDNTSPTRQDEFGHLLQALSKGGENLRSVLAQVGSVTRQLSAAPKRSRRSPSRPVPGSTARRSRPTRWPPP